MPSADDSHLISYMLLRRAVGVLGMALPVLVAAVGFAVGDPGELLPSISDYYAHRTRDIFVGLLVAIGGFLWAYRGYDAHDNLAGNIAGLAAGLVAFFPNSGTPAERTLHFVGATVLLLTLAYFSWFLFTKSAGGMTPMKETRNRVYRTCAVIIVACVAGCGAYMVLGQGTGWAHLHPIFWLETAALWAFGFSWFVKGEALLGDKAAPEFVAGTST